MQNSVKLRVTPFAVKLCMYIAVMGLVAPIYGIPLGNFKLTVFRMMMLPLCVLWFSYGVRKINKDSANVIVIFGVFAFVRCIGLFFISADKTGGIQQVAWFLEGVLFLLFVNSFSLRFDDFTRIFLRILFFVGSISIAIMGIQFILFLCDYSWIIPFSTTQFGYPESLRPWTYPIYGGNIIGPFFEYNMAGSMCAFFIAVFLPFSLEKSNFIGIKRHWVVLVIAMTIFALVGTGSKQSFVSMLMVAILVVLRSTLYNKIKAVFLLIAIISATAFVVNSVDISNLSLIPQTTFTRFESAAESNDITGGRLVYIQEILEDLEHGGLIWGIGEGMGIHTAHNAYLIVLQENGIIGSFLLLWLSVYFFFKSAVPSALVRMRIFPISLRTSSMGVLLTWMILLFINWAQLNANISFLYLAVPLILLNGVYSDKDSIRLSASSK